MESKPNTIEAEASSWVARLDSGALSAEEQRDFDSWIQRDRRHHGAFVRAKAAWLDIDRIAALETRSAPPIQIAPTRNVNALRRRVLVAATLAALGIGIGMLWLTSNRVGQTYASEVGEVRKIGLTDGSELTLNTNTRAIVRFRKERREIALDQGEAQFKVAHDSARPFIVHANDVQVRAVGTAFTVRVDDARVDIIVTEGIVDVLRGNGSSTTDTQRVTASHRAVLASSGSRVDIEPVSPDAMRRQLAWREGMVAFSGEPLSVAVAEINRYSRHAIRIDDPALAASPVVGIFNANDIEAFVNAAAEAFGAEVEYHEGVIHLKVRSPGSDLRQESATR